jgi:hypothetical protein
MERLRTGNKFIVNDFSSKTFAVFDHFGLFCGLAQRLAESGARVLYSTPVDRYDRLNEAVIGDGLKGIEWVEEFWPFKSQIDCFVFPDIRHNGLQAELRSQNLPVWGSQGGMKLEQARVFFLEKLKELGLDVPPYEVVVGVSNLGAFLKSKKDIWIKVSKWRGTWETFHWREWDMDWSNLDSWAVKFGGKKEQVQFICFPKIDTDLEIGADTYNVDGQWPSMMLHGIERKDAAYFSAVTPRKKMPEQILPIMDAFSPYLKEVGYRNQWSMEVRVTDKKNFFIDATCRGGLPSTNTFLAAKNIPEVIYHGARGEFVEIDYGFKFSAECMVNAKTSNDAWATVKLEPEVRKNLLTQQCCEVAGQLWYPPLESGGKSLGWLRSTGDTPKEVLENMNKLADALPDGVDAQVEDLAAVIREIESEEEQGIKFSDVEMPDSAIVLEDSK